MAGTGTVVVTGAAGFVGSHLVDRLIAGGYSVEAVDNLSSGSLTNLETARASSQMRFHQMDIRAPDFVDLVGRLGPDAIIHLAGHVDRPGSLLDPLYDADVNILGTLNVLEAVRGHEVPKVSVVVHGLFRREEQTSGRVIVGQEPTTPSHIAAEAVVEYTRVHGDVYGLDVRVIALANVYGPRQLAQQNGPVVANFVSAVSSGLPVPVQGDGAQSRDFLYVDDAVDAIARSLDAESGAIVPVGTGLLTPVSELARLVVEASNSEVVVEAGPARLLDRPGVGFPTQDAATRLNWRAWTPLSEGVASLLEHQAV